MSETTTPTELNGIEIVAFADADAWEAWLAEHHQRQEGVWIRMAKKASGVPSVTPSEAIDVALCWGWIDGQRKGQDATWFLQKFTPRRKRSLWSQVNIARVEALAAAGRMREPGLAEVEAAKADGRWEAAYASQATAEVPDDLAAALAARPGARAAFDALGRSARYAMLHQLMTARTEATRARRLERLIASLGVGDEVH
jgi:uncharacterized protein YdeI (YjbR/CyaY-like superfamily)